MSENVGQEISASIVTACAVDFLLPGVQEFPNPIGGCGLFDGVTGAIPRCDVRPALKKQDDDLALLLYSFGATAATPAGVLNGKMKRC